MSMMLGILEPPSSQVASSPSNRAFTFQKKSYVTPTGQIGAGVMQNQGNSTASGLSYFSQMEAANASHEDEDRGGSVQPIAGPMEGFDDPDPNNLSGIGGP